MANDGMDLREYRKWVRDLKDFKLDKSVKKNLRLAGDLIVADAKAEAGRYSSTIPATIRHRQGKSSIIITAGNEHTPLAVLFEVGNRRKTRHGIRTARAGSKTFSHPLFGDRSYWYDQPMHPYMTFAIRKNKTSIEAFEGRIVADAFREVGWKG